MRPSIRREPCCAWEHRSPFSTAASARICRPSTRRFRRPRRRACASSFWPRRIASLGDADGNVKAIEIVKTRLGEYDKSGRRRPIPTDEVQRFECDSVILAVGETFDRTSAAPPDWNSKRKAPSSWIASRWRPAAQLLCGRRRDHRRIQRVQRDGRRQAGGAQDRRAPDGRERWERSFRSSNTAARRRESRASAAATRRTPCRGGSRSLAGRSGCRPQPEGGAGRMPPLPALRFEITAAQPERPWSEKGASRCLTKRFPSALMANW
jgi:hypothetical protein